MNNPCAHVRCEITASVLGAEALTITHIHGAPEVPPTMCGSIPGAWHGAVGTRAAARLASADAPPNTLDAR